VFLSDLKDRLQNKQIFSRTFSEQRSSQLSYYATPKSAQAKTNKKILVFKKNLCVKDLCGKKEQKEQKVLCYKRSIFNIIYLQGNEEKINKYRSYDKTKWNP
jgi:hypothetical protein